jgi:copper chaperone
VAKVTPKLNENPDIKEWNVDTTNPEKILTVKTDNLLADDVKDIVASAGFKAEAIN